MTPQPPKKGRLAPRLYLVTPAAADPAQLRLDLLGALDSADIAAVLMRLPDGIAVIQDGSVNELLTCR